MVSKFFRQVDNCFNRFRMVSSTPSNFVELPDASGNPHASIENEPFPTKIGEIEAHFCFQNWLFTTKICELEAHVYFENWQFSKKISGFLRWIFSMKIKLIVILIRDSPAEMFDKNCWNWGGLFMWRLTIFDGNWRNSGAFFVENWQISKKISEIEAYSPRRNCRVYSLIKFIGSGGSDIRLKIDTRFLASGPAA